MRYPLSSKTRRPPEPNKVRIPGAKEQRPPDFQAVKCDGVDISVQSFQVAPATVLLHRLCAVAVDKSPLQCAGLNRHEVEDERALRERSSDPLGLESCAATARDTAKRR
jgi:hypothetical protein